MILILFKRGEMWSEQLTVSSSGFSGNPITFASYGNGAGPILKQPSNNNTDAFLSIRHSYLIFNDITFDGNGVSQTSGDGVVVAATNNCSNLIFSGCTIKNARNNAAGCGVTSDSCTHITVQGCTLENSKLNLVTLTEEVDNWTITGNTIINPTVPQSCGVRIAGGGDNHTITNNTIRNGDYGIYVSGDSSNITIAGNVATNWAQTTPTQYGHGIEVAGTGRADNYIISYNTVSDPATDRDGYELYWQGTPTDITIAGNTYTNSNSPVGDSGLVVDMFPGGRATITDNRIYNAPHYGIFILGGSGHNIQRNHVKDCGEDGYWGLLIRSAKWKNVNCVATNHTVAYNIIEDCYGGMASSAIDNLTSDGMAFYNNTIVGTYGTDVPGDTYKPDCSFMAWLNNNSLIFKNNIFADNKSAYFIRVHISSMAGMDSDYNLFYGSAKWKWGHDPEDTTLAEWQAGSGNDTYGLSEDPQFVQPTNNNFHLLSTSPCRDRGVDVGLAKDYDGSLIPYGSGVDIGALEYVGISSPKNLLLTPIQ